MTASHRALRFPETSALLKNTHSFIYLFYLIDPSSYCYLR